jgi:hypothetical protein
MPPPKVIRKKRDDKKKDDASANKHADYEIPLRDTELESIIKDYLISFHKYKGEVKDFLWDKMNANKKSKEETNSQNPNPTTEKVIPAADEDLRKVIESAIKRMKDPVSQEDTFTTIIHKITDFLQHEDKFIKKQNC